ncbi:MAG: GAF domain-containing sensor histidine kinase [Mycobacteriales bacterium]
MIGWVVLAATAATVAAWYAGRAMSTRRQRDVVRRLREVVATTGTCLSIRDDNELATALAGRLAGLLGLDAVSIRVVRGHGLELIGSHGAACWSQDAPLALGEGAPGWVWATGEPSTVDDLLTHPGSRPQQMSMRSGAYLPGHVDGQVVVVLSVESRRAGAFGPAELQLLAPVASLLATALHSRQLLRDAERFEDRLLTLVGHEMRTPLTAVIATFTMLINKGDRLTDEVRDNLQLLGLRSGRRLERVIQTMLMAAQLERDLINFDTTAVELADIVAESVRLSGDDAVAIDSPAGVYVVAAPHLLTTALQQLIDNALLHGAAPIRVTASTQGPLVKVEVRDHGPGIPEDALGEVLGRFRRTDDAVLTRPGSGLGLYVTRRLVEGMGGDLEIWSEPGRGCRASIRLAAYLPVDGEVDNSPTVVEGLRTPSPLPH